MNLLLFAGSAVQSQAIVNLTGLQTHTQCHVRHLVILHQQLFELTALFGLNDLNIFIYDICALVVETFSVWIHWCRALSPFTCCYLMKTLNSLHMQLVGGRYLTTPFVVATMCVCNSFKSQQRSWDYNPTSAKISSSSFSLLSQGMKFRYHFWSYLECYYFSLI